MLKKIILTSVVVLAVALYLRSGEVVRDGKTIKTKSGAVLGRISVSRDGKDYYAWHKIPFAKPPLGKLRFADPVPVDPWNEVLDGRGRGPECAQVNAFNFPFMPDFTVEEDCLQLSIYAPKKVHDDILEGKRRRVPVIFYIHGGAYIVGSSRMFSGGYFMDEDVIVVSTNYRLDILGFLTTGDTIARGNQGLKDQTMALKWVKDNIEFFGGDPNQITLFGQSAGAASVHQQMLSPLSKGLFHKVFAQSGAASNTWGFIPTKISLELTKDTAKKLNCPTENNHDLVDCLRNVDIKDLVESRVTSISNEHALMKPHMHGYGFEPIVEVVKDDKAFLTDHPLKLTAEGKSHKVPLLIGHATDEGLFSRQFLQQEPEMLVKFEKEFTQAMQTIFNIEKPNVEEIANKILKFYLPNGKEIGVKERLRLYTDLLGDGFFHLDIRETVRLQRKFSPVYYYICNNTNIPNIMWILTETDKRLPKSIDFLWRITKNYVNEHVLGNKRPFEGVTHAADIGMYYPTEDFNMWIREGDPLYEYSKELVKMIAQFAYDDTKMEFRGVKIPPNPPEGTLIVAEFKNENVVIGPEPYTDRMEFLRSLKIRP